MATDSSIYAADFPNGAMPFQSLILAPSGEEMFSNALALTLQSPTDERAALLEQLLQIIAAFVSAHPEMRAWTYTVHAGSDGSRIFSGGVGLSVVVDPNGRLWRGRTYEDFETIHTITPTTCEVASMTPRYDQMREYRLR